MPKFGRPSVAAFAAFHPLCVAGDPPASDAGVAASASMRVVALLPPCDAMMVSLSARACPSGTALPFKAWLSGASAGEPASALSTFAIGALLLDVCLPAALGLAACAGVATLAVCADTAILASCAATTVLESPDEAAVLASCPAAEVLASGVGTVSCDAGALLASGIAAALPASAVAKWSLAFWLDATLLASTIGSADFALAVAELPITLF